MTVKRITPVQLFEKIQNQGKVILLDVRAEEKYKNDHIKDNNIENINIVKTKIFDQEDKTYLGSLPSDQEIIVTCTTGNSAAKCAAILAEKEYDVTVLEGGNTAWKKFLEEK
ncbi:rhodanese-like domain-containing protein [Bacillus dakarensis]|uniref:rhodanese-like domain-containing protein n=1 Tax=Robertmurraya dakarensis TaxID=1926278 RepID=UPI000981C298|nr:rhodanese-like domain-containing protein [Bacillus dakarensis]